MTNPSEPPFHAEQPENDPSIRILTSTAEPQTLVNTFPGQAFDHAGLEADANLLIPLDRLRELVADGEIGELAPREVSMCGHLPKPRHLIDSVAPEIARMFVHDGVDVVLLVPA
jgi:D-proline reductase (dithiol) PrdB